MSLVFTSTYALLAALLDAEGVDTPFISTSPTPFVRIKSPLILNVSEFVVVSVFPTIEGPF